MNRLDANLDVAGGYALSLAAGEAAIVERVDVVTALGGVGESWRSRRRHVVRIDGRDVGAHATAGRVRRGLGLVIAPVVAVDVTIHDQLASIAGASRAAALIAGAPLLAGRGGDPAGILSGGERRMLAWLRCAATDPRVVVLDAAGTGLDADGLAWCSGTVASWRAAGVCVVVRPGRPEERDWAV